MDPPPPELPFHIVPTTSTGFSTAQSQPSPAQPLRGLSLSEPRRRSLFPGRLGRTDKSSSRPGRHATSHYRPRRQILPLGATEPPHRGEGWAGRAGAFPKEAAYRGRAGIPVRGRPIRGLTLALARCCWLAATHRETAQHHSPPAGWLGRNLQRPDCAWSRRGSLPAQPLAGACCPPRPLLLPSRPRHFAPNTHSGTSPGGSTSAGGSSGRGCAWCTARARRKAGNRVSRRSCGPTPELRPVSHSSRPGGKRQRRPSPSQPRSWRRCDSVLLPLPAPPATCSQRLRRVTPACAHTRRSGAESSSSSSSASLAGEPGGTAPRASPAQLRLEPLWPAARLRPGHSPPPPARGRGVGE